MRMLPSFSRWSQTLIKEPSKSRDQTIIKMSPLFREASKWRQSRSTNKSFLNTCGKPPKKHSKKCRVISRIPQMISHRNRIPRTISKNLSSQLQFLRSLLNHSKNRIKVINLKHKLIVISKLMLHLQIKNRLIQSKKLETKTKQILNRSKKKMLSQIKAMVNRLPKTQIQNRRRKQRRKKNSIKRRWKEWAMRSRRLKIC